MSDQLDKPGGLRWVEGDPSKVVDFKPRPVPVVETIREPGGAIGAASFETRRVQLIACSNCGSPGFKLTHDQRIACAVCSIEIKSLHWYDVNLQSVVRKSPT
jgi:hypothetical protein